MARSSSSTKSKATRGKSSNAKGSGKKKTKTASSTGLKTKADVAEAIFKFICEEHAFGMTEWNRADLASAIGFGNPRTEKFAHGLKILLCDGRVETRNKGIIVLSDKGIAEKPKDVQPKTLEEVHERYIKQLEAKATSAKCVRGLWEILSDRETHNIDEIAGELGFTNPRSFMNTKVIGLMEKMGLVTKKGKNVTMTDKAFPSLND